MINHIRLQVDAINEPDLQNTGMPNPLTSDLSRLDLSVQTFSSFECSEPSSKLGTDQSFYEESLGHSGNDEVWKINRNTVIGLQPYTPIPPHPQSFCHDLKPWNASLILRGSARRSGIQNIIVWGYRLFGCFTENPLDLMVPGLRSRRASECC